ncbi:glycosyltransferase [Algoriphagus antarcticus]|uniref:Glycosyl transferase family 2 n=1 Tax=Algoriphagus antarcticus TaxID=238540 RepID=A0A3E0DNL7_9BACT|nr:glycosyltransferase [Algoriphagus antarcticus]REG83082.1 glycosyl transferase family 2 [Algoriphagus antarcticus]
MEEADLVTVICIAFNHEKWIEKALDSVLLQDYRLKELIIADNGSSDQSAGIIQEWVKKHSMELPVSANFKSESIPYCRLFNEMLNLAKGDFIVDLSGDDFLYPQHLSLSIERIRQVPNSAFVFSDADICEENGAKESYYKGNEVDDLRERVLARGFYQTLISRSYISSPTVVFRSQILKQEGGYDETLSYEDFDIQIRLTSKYPVVYSDHVGVYKRKHSHSLSANQYRRYQSEMLPSTFRVCEKIREMNESLSEDLALKERVLFELKHALWSANFDSAKGFVNLANELNAKGLEFRLYKVWLRLRLDISWLYVQLT